MSTGPSGFLLNDYLRSQLGFSLGANYVVAGQPVRKWISDAGKQEDCCLRFLYHFHNPLFAWDHSGFKGIYLSSILWAQTPPATQSISGDFSWHDGRDFFYDGLTDPRPIIREVGLARTFRTLGQLMHLVEDQASPAHTRNDGHVFYSFEKRVRNEPVVNPLTVTPVPFDPSTLREAG